MPRVTIALGSIIATAGVICFLALSGQGQSEAIRSIGSASFAIGVLMIAGGLYLDTRRMQAQYQQSTAYKSKKTERLCASCNQESSVVFCRVHVLRLCLACFEKHDDGSHCTYVPAKRATAAYK